MSEAIKKDGLKQNDPPFCRDKVHPFAIPGLDNDYARSAVKEIAPDVWMVEGVVGFSFFLSPPSSNVFILRDGDMVFMLDSGLQPFYRQRILDVLRQFKAKGAKTLVLMDSQGHWDHSLNNDVVLEAGYDQVRFLLPEPEVPVIESLTHWLGDFRAMEYYSDPYGKWIPLIAEIENFARTFPAYEEPQYQDVWRSILALKDEKTPAAFRMALRFLFERVIGPGKRSLSECAEILSLDSREFRRYGDSEFYGWQVGRFFIIHDGSHSPGHVCLYDPQNRLLLTGDVTVEINPPFFDCSFDKCVSTNRAFRRMAEQGYVALASDAHRSKEWFPKLIEGLGVDPLTPLQLTDCMRGQEECIGFFGAFEKFFAEMRDEVLAAHERIGEATIEEIVQEFFKSETKSVKFKKAFIFPSRPELLVMTVLREHGFKRRVDGDRILFTPPEKWRL
jgi:glyoxylase-like metal-dependent hydrolase (beta-lactamase superfamily II)